MALLLIFTFALRLKWFPASGYIPLSEGLWPNLQAFILPSLSIALIEWVPLMRVLRTDMIVTLREDFITVARAKGMPTWRILCRDALKPSSFTLITIIGLQIGHWIGAAVIIARCADGQVDDAVAFQITNVSDRAAEAVIVIQYAFKVAFGVGDFL